MNRAVVIIYIVILAVYLLFTRTPDFFEGETQKATIHFVKDSTGQTAPFAFYVNGKQHLKIDARYVLRSLSEGEERTIIYDTQQPQAAVIYTFWGYWITWQELIGSIVLWVALYQVARAITSNPTPEGLLSELEDDKPKPRKPRYD